MMKRLTALLLALLFPMAALAEVYEGKTVALSEADVVAETSGVIMTLEALVGGRVDAGDALATLAGEKAFATQDGTVSLLHADVGEEIDGTLLELTPLERYRVRCAVDKAYQTPETTLVHSGEAVYLRCIRDSSHLAMGVVTSINGGEFEVLTLGGELYVGEAVYLYRDAAFTADQRIGIGTVLSNDVERYDAKGTVTLLRISEGNPVERGQLLFVTDGGSIDAPVSGIVTEIDVQIGDPVAEGQRVARVVPDGQVGVEIALAEADAARIKPGQSIELTPAGAEESIPGTIFSISWIAEAGGYVARVVPDGDVSLPLGLSVTVRI